MKRKKKPSFGWQVLVLIWTAYYFAMRCTGGQLNGADWVICGAAALAAVVSIIRGVIIIYRSRKG